MDNIEKLIFSVKRKTVLYRTGKLLLDFSVLFFAAALVNYAADRVGYSPFFLRITVLSFFLLTAGFCIFDAVRKLLNLKNADEDIAGGIQKINPWLKDDLINAVQLKKNVIDGTSYELAVEFVKLVSANITAASVAKPAAFKSLKYRLVLFLVLGIVFVSAFNSLSIKRYFFPFGGASFLLSPKDTSVVSGGNVNISVVSTDGRNYPYLYYRVYGGGPWHVSRMKKNEAKKYSARIERIADDTEYYARLSDMRSSKYRITVVPPTAIADIKLEYIYPSYTGLSGKIVESADIDAPVGTIVKLTASSNKKIREAYLVTDANEKIKMEVNGLTLRSRLVIQNQSEYWIEATAQDGYTDDQPVRYRINIQQNKPPAIEIVSPAEDVVVSEKGKLKIVYSGEDDFGIRRVDFNCLSLGKKFGIKKYAGSQRKLLDEYELKIDELGLIAGDVVQYRLEASDDDIASEQNTGISKTYTIEVFSYGMEHKKIEEGLTDFRKKMLEILAKQFESRKMTENKEMEKAGASQKEIKNMTEQGLKNIDGIIERMKDDPLTTFSIFNEYKNLRESLAYLKDEKMSAAADMISKNQPAEAGKMQDEIISELERLSTLSENIFERQKMEDVVSSARDMRDSSLELRDQLEELKKTPSKEQMKKLAEATDKIVELMKQLSDKLSKMPQELPDEFVNSQSVKNIDFSGMGDAANALKNALNSGNFDDAIKAAEQLASKISQMLKTFDDLAKDVADNSVDKLKEETIEAMGQLNRIIENQQGVLDETEKINVDYKKRVLELQKNLLKKLADTQSRAVEALTSAKNELAKSRIPYHGVTGLYNSANAKMNNVLNEFTTGKIDKSRALLAEIIAETADAQRQLDPAVKNDTGTVNSPENRSLQSLNLSKKLEEEILTEFTGFSPSPQDILNQEQLSALDRQSAKQQDIQKDTAGLGKKLYGLSSKTSSISKQMLDDITESQVSMDTASKELLGKNAPPAVEAERDALQHLLKSKDSLQNSAGQMEQMSKGGRAGCGAPSVKMRSGGSDGSSGFMTGFVKIPALDDYRPPKEFREDVMDALRRKYPEKYEKTIKDYYKRLIE